MSWAFTSATARSLEDYSEADGHDATWLGQTRFTLFRDRLDRVFACERYALDSGDGGSDLDLLYERLSKRDIATMPRLASDLVRRADLKGSPGWAWQGYRFLLAACTYGKIDRVPWPQKSRTKQRVARQRNPESQQPSLFEGFADEELGGLEAAEAAAFELDLTTFVVAHSLDPVSEQMELVFGRPRLNRGGGQAWHWRQSLLEVPPAGGGGLQPAPQPTGPTPVPDAPVRLRKAAEQRDGRAGAQP